jgi:hypothetical protein
MKRYVIGLLRTTNKRFSARICEVLVQCNRAHVRRGFTDTEPMSNVHTVDGYSVNVYWQDALNHNEYQVNIRSNCIVNYYVQCYCAPFKRPSHNTLRI